MNKKLTQFLIIVTLYFSCFLITNAQNLEQNKTYLNYIKQAQRYESQNKILKANEYYLKAEKIYPEKFEARFGLAKTYGWLHKDKLALKYYQELLKEFPNNIALLEEYAKYLKDNKNYEQSLKIYEKLYELTKNKKYKINIAEINLLQKNQIYLNYIKQAKKYESQNKTREAHQYYLKAQKIFPTRYEALFGLARTYGSLYKNKLEFKYYREKFKETPNDVPFLEEYAKYLKDNQDYDQALKIYNRLFELTKNNKYKTNIAEIISLKNYREQNKKFLSYIKQAQEYESQGKIPEANQYYLKAHELFPDRFEAQFGLAKTYGWLNKDKPALKYYQELFKQAPSNVALLEAYAVYLKDNKDYDQTLKIYNKLLELTKNDKYKTNIAEIISLKKGQKPKQNYQQQNKKFSDYVKADKKDIIKFKKSYAIQNKNLVQNKNFFNYIKQAQEYESQGKILESNQYYLKAHEIFPERYEAKFGLAKTYGWLHKDELALEYYRNLLKETPDSIDLLEVYANYLRDTKNYGQTLEIYNKLISLTKNEKYKVNIAEIFLLQKKYDTALNLYFEIYNKNPDNIQAQKGIALSYFISGDFKKAGEFYQNYLNKTQDPESELNYAKSLFYTGNIPLSLQILENFIKLYPNNVDALSTIADIYLAQNEPQKARDILCKAVLLDSENIKLKIQIAKVYIAVKNYDQAKNLLCELAKIKPDNFEIWESLGEIYMAQNDSPKAIEMFCRAVSIDTENIKLKIKVAKAYIAVKNYIQAKNLLLELAKVEPCNSEILESLGDISFFESNFNQALKYYQNIADFNNNNRIIYKIAQSEHYNKNLDTGENLYKYLLNEPEFTDRAQIGLAEIQITRGEPLIARKILNNVLAKDPQNIQANKNLAVSFNSTGDNFQSIEILEKLPKDEDINFNLAKAYNELGKRDVSLETGIPYYIFNFSYGALGRNDKALELLKNNNLDRAKELEADIQMRLRPDLEPLFNYYELSGNANAVRWNKLGGNAYFYPKPNIKSIGSITTTKYISDVVSARGTLYSIGSEGRPNDHFGYTSAVGIEDFSYKGSIILGNMTFKAFLNDCVTLNSGYIRYLDEIDSYMSAAGVVPEVGPFANQLVGRIIDNKFMILNAAFKLPHKTYAYAGYNIGNRYGSNSPANLYQEAPVGAGIMLFSAPEEFFINQIMAGYDFYYLDFRRDMSGFGGANLNNSPIGSDGTSPYPTPSNSGVGGYFSPTFFLANKFPITIKGGFKKTGIRYLLAGFLGSQSMRGPFELVNNAPGIHSTLYYGYNIGLTYNETGRIGARAYYDFNNYRTVRQHLFRVNLIIRF
ncbi:MAG TPA: hypothetical protein DDW90_01450 [Cyanobacteria bacterium UBA9971]|nr:hypothetical protein [Cyanobacteria bacterium UBA9971]